jgi:hypothetical protein
MLDARASLLRQLHAAAAQSLQGQCSAEAQTCESQNMRKPHAVYQSVQLLTPAYSIALSC